MSIGGDLARLLEITGRRKSPAWKNQPSFDSYFSIGDF